MTRGVFLVLYLDRGMSGSFFGGQGFTPTGGVEEGAHRNQVQVNVVFTVLLCSRRVLGVLRARFTGLLEVVVLSVWQAALLGILCDTRSNEFKKM